jgi:hypothetical protein
MRNRSSGFEAKTLTNCHNVFEAKQIVDLDFEAEPRNTCSSSPCARCRPHTASPNLLIIRLPSTRPVRPSPVLCTRSTTPATILVVAHPATPATCTPRDKQTRFFKQNKDKSKINETVPDLNSNFTKSMTHHNQTKKLTLGFSISPLMSPLTTKDTKFKVRI